MTNIKKVKVKNFDIANNLPFTLISGSCVIESESHALDMAGKLNEITKKLNINFVYKSSFDKANRTSIKGHRGLGMEKGLAILETVKKQYNIPVVSDVHESSQCNEVASVVDILQIPAFLCRQTDLIIAAAKTNKAVNIKKGQFLAPWDMKNIVKKFEEASDNRSLMLCERGASFGYNNLVVDITGLPIMAETGYPVIMDVTHAVQKPGGLGEATGGNRDMVPYLAKAATAVGIAGVFMETHQDPDNAPSDGPNMINIKDVENLLVHLQKLDVITKNLK